MFRRARDNSRRLGKQACTLSAVLPAAFRVSCSASLGLEHEVGPSRIRQRTSLGMRGWPCGWALRIKRRTHRPLEGKQGNKCLGRDCAETLRKSSDHRAASELR